MTTNTKQFMSAFALSAAALFLGACKDQPPTQDPEPASDPASSDPTSSSDPAVAAGGDEQVKCFGINECSGQSVCAVNKPDLGIEHACAGENACQGKGWIKVSRTECESQSGEVLGTI
jgi:hypothetical protein